MYPKRVRLSTPVVLIVPRHVNLAAGRSPDEGMENRFEGFLQVDEPVLVLVVIS